MHPLITRRQSLQILATSSLTLAGGWLSGVAIQSPSRLGPVCAFGKHLQWLSYEEVAAFLKDHDFDGLEATVRKGGQIKPEQVAEELPKLHAVLQSRGLQLPCIVTDINAVDSPYARTVLEVAAKLGVVQYRMNYYRYDVKEPIKAQLAGFRSQLKELAALNAELGIQAVYQNHAGANYVGGSNWDQWELLEGIDVDHVAAAFDPRHTVAEGSESWPVRWKLLQDKTRTLYLKDFRWEGGKAVHAPLGQGDVPHEFFQRVLTECQPGIPVSIHVEYVSSKDQSLQPDAMEALASDRQFLKKHFGV